MALKPGLYRIHYVPPHVVPPFVGGVQAVGVDLASPVLAMPDSPHIRGVRVWQVSCAPDNEEQRIITAPGFKPSGIYQGIGPVLPGWGRIPRKKIETEGLDPAALREADIKADKEAEEEGILPFPDLPVLFTPSIKNWNIEESIDGGGDPTKATYVISVPTKLPGAISAVTIDKYHLATKTYPIYPSSFPLPAWQFIPVEGDE
ncbi:hypothetical protein EST38_g6044 [Candolleomyces aberdarensis]|uniref:Uncharacterized protein n=1 Tax=Candolleomyces aberdarensis TaxID=2316362 RepID=A0A4Q2DM12_9AGAR|nr:hypothetical protein EST38_g6044 [Candolleomyces aberdarensis]